MLFPIHSDAIKGRRGLLQANLYFSLPVMAEKSIYYKLHKRKASMGRLRGKEVVQAYPVVNQSIDFRTFCEQVAEGTTFTDAEVAAVLQLAAECARAHLLAGNSVHLSDFGTLQPSFESSLVDVSQEPFNAQKHIRKPHAIFRPSKRYFNLHEAHIRKAKERPKKVTKKRVQ